LLPDDPRQYGQYWNHAKKWDDETVEEIADLLDDLKPPDFMPVDLAAELSRPTVIDANELLWAARILGALVRVHRNVIADMREKGEGGAGDPGELRRGAGLRSTGAAVDD
jgi:hypothetical protein